MWYGGGVIPLPPSPSPTVPEELVVDRRDPDRRLPGTENGDAPLAVCWRAGGDSGDDRLAPPPSPYKWDSRDLSSPETIQMQAMSAFHCYDVQKLRVLKEFSFSPILEAMVRPFSLFSLLNLQDLNNMTYQVTGKCALFLQNLFCRRPSRSALASGVVAAPEQVAPLPALSQTAGCVIGISCCWTGSRHSPRFPNTRRTG